MYNAIYAELLKLRHHRATWLLVWIYPILVGILSIVTIAIDIFGEPATGQTLIVSAWIDQNTLVWNIPMEPIGRYLIAGFAAIAFAGEYSWNTWKLVVPARERWQLIVAKWVVVVILLYVALLMASLIMLGGALLRPLVGGEAIPAGVAAQSVLGAHAEGFAHAAFPIAYTIAWAGLLGVLTRSMLATVITFIVIIALEQFLGPLAMLTSSFSVEITRLTLNILPFYHVANVFEYLQTGEPRLVRLDDGSRFSTSLQLSSAIMMVWIAGLSALTLFRFQRQDMN